MERFEARRVYELDPFHRLTASGDIVISPHSQFGVWKPAI